MTTMITGTAGIISHGVMATVWTFWPAAADAPADRGRAQAQAQEAQRGLAE